MRKISKKGEICYFLAGGGILAEYPSLTSDFELHIGNGWVYFEVEILNPQSAESGENYLNIRPHSNSHWNVPIAQVLRFSPTQTIATSKVLNSTTGKIIFTNQYRLRYKVRVFCA